MNSPTPLPRTGLGAAALALTAIGGILVAIGSIGTWVSSDLADLSIGGLDKDGPVLIALVVLIGIQAGVAFARGVKRPLILLVSVGLAALTTLIAFVDLSDVNSAGFGAEAGWGLQLATYSSLALLAGTVMLVIAARRETDVRGGAVSAAAHS